MDGEECEGWLDDLALLFEPTGDEQDGDRDQSTIQPSPHVDFRPNDAVRASPRSSMMGTWPQGHACQEQGVLPPKSMAAPGPTLQRVLKRRRYPCMAELRKVDPQYTLRPLNGGQRRPEPQMAAVSSVGQSSKLEISSSSSGFNHQTSAGTEGVPRLSPASAKRRALMPLVLMSPTDWATKSGSPGSPTDAAFDFFLASPTGAGMDSGYAALSPTTCDRLCGVDYCTSPSVDDSVGTAPPVPDDRSLPLPALHMRGNNAAANAVKAAVSAAAAAPRGAFMHPGLAGPHRLPIADMFVNAGV